MKGTICNVRNYGTIVQLAVRPDGKEVEQFIHMDWRMFKNFQESVCGEAGVTGRLLGLHIEYDGSTIWVI